MTSDLDLLRRFACENSQDAFAEIIRRHLNLVYSAALRQVHSPQLAEEISQSVFADLARVAATPSSPKILTPWLYSVTRRTAIDVIRKESRRQLREQIAAEMQTVNATESSAGFQPAWSDIEPLLDDAMTALDETDRAVILLRYFENKNLREVGEQLKISDDAAQKRVSRAVEKLREFFSKRNITIGASGLTVLISANAIQSAPIGLSATILTATAGITATLGMTMIHKILIAGFAVAAIGSGIYSIHLQKEIGALQQQQSSLNQQIAQLSSERDDATNQLAAAQQENERLRANENELLKLRGEISRSRNQQTVLPEAAEMKTNNSPDTKIMIHIKAKLVSIPAEDSQALGVDLVSGVGLLTASQFKTINDALQGASDVSVLAMPQVITSNGGEADFYVGKSALVDGTNANVGTDLDVTPYFSTNSSTFNLNFVAKLSLLTGDFSQPDLQTIQATNQTTLSLGQTLVLKQALPNGAWISGSITNTFTDPRSLLMFVTPTIPSASELEQLRKSHEQAMAAKTNTISQKTSDLQ